MGFPRFGRFDAIFDWLGLVGRGRRVEDGLLQIGRLGYGLSLRWLERASQLGDDVRLPLAVDNDLAAVNSILAVVVRHLPFLCQRGQTPGGRA